MMKILFIVCFFHICHTSAASEKRGCSETKQCSSAHQECMKRDGLKRFFCESDLCEKNCTICQLCNDGEKYAVASPITDREKCLEEHNVLRRLHKNTPDLVWDDKLADIAQQYAEHLAERVDFRHSSVGENMYMKINSGKSTLSSCFDATLAWYNEIRDYDYSSHVSLSVTKETRHFQQIVWKANRKAGFGIARHAKSKTLYVIGRYANAPIDGQEKDNIRHLKND